MAKRQDAFVGNVFKLVSGSVVAQIISVLAALVLARLYKPGDFGVSALFISITSIITVIACLRYELSIMLPERDDEASSLLWGSIFLVVIIAGVSALIIAFWRSQIAQLFKMPDLMSYLWLVPPSILVGGIFLATRYWNSRMKDFWHLSTAQVVNSGTANAVRLGIGVSKHANAGGLILGGVLGSVISTGILARQTWKNDRHLLLRGIHLSRVVEGLKRYRKFPLFSIWSALLNAVSWQLPPFLLAFFFSPAVVGFYALGTRVIRLPMRLLSGAIAQVFYQKASEQKSNTGVISHVVREIYKRLVAFSMLPLLLLTLIGGDLFVVVFGNHWAEAGIFAQILSPYMFLVFISSPMSLLFSVREKQEFGLFFNLALFITRFVSLWVGGFLGSARIALSIFAVTGVIMYAVLSFYIMSIAGVSYRWWAGIILRHFLYSIPGIAVVIFLKMWLKCSSVITLFVSLLILIIYAVFFIYNDQVLRKELAKLRLFRKILST